MQSNGKTEVEPTPEEWKKRALTAERAIYNINDQMCSCDYVYGESGDNEDDMNDLGEAIWEAAELHLDEVPVPADAARRNSDVRPPGNDRRLFAVHNGWGPEQGGLVAVGREDDSKEAFDLLGTRWKELCKQASLSFGSARFHHVNLHAKKPREINGWSETELRTLLLEHEPNSVKIVGERFTATRSQS